MADAENQPFNPGSWREERTTDAPQAPTEQPSDDKPKRGKPWKRIVFGLLILGIIAAIGADCLGLCGPSEEEKAEERRKGFHCLSGYDGSHFDFKYEVQQKLNDPDSFEHVRTFITPVNENGLHELEMRFRASNAFGAKTLATAYGIVQNDGCDALFVGME